MNTRGPKGGKGATNQAPIRGTTVRSSSYTAAGGKNKGDMVKAGSRNLGGQMPQYSRVAGVRQARVNKGPMTDFSVSRQDLSQTRPPKSASYRYSQTTTAGGKDGGRPRETKNTMSSGRGSSKQS